MKRILLTLSLLITSNAYSAPSRLKDLVSVKGVRENPILGYGLVIGLNGTGDAGGEITNTSLKKMFEKLGLNPKTEITSKNVAAVVVTPMPAAPPTPGDCRPSRCRRRRARSPVEPREQGPGASVTMACASPGCLESRNTIVGLSF